MAVFAALLLTIVSIAVRLFQTDPAHFLFLFVLGPILLATSAALLAYTIIGKGRPKRLTLLSALATLWVVLAVFFVFRPAIRTSARWLIWSRNFKDRVLAEPAPASGEFRHVEWDGWGWGGNDTTEFSCL
jgi:hypothetical protein